ncbi:MAG: UDP-glucose 4-epimerase GalE [Bacteroidales bacterium]|nr:UDP-glucose 4-epimerase GalE [Bacteroidales bacterium]
MAKILVTGGTGYIGSHTSVELLNAGFEVIIIDNLSNSNIEVLDGIKKITGKNPEFHKIDLTDPGKTNTFFNSFKEIDSVIHFAAYKAVGESVSNPLKYYENNISSLLNILKNIRKHSIKSLVFSSSCTVYGQPEKLPVTEDSPVLKADSPYGNTKQISEEIIFDFVNSVSFFNSICLRYFNPIGAHESAEIGELPIGTPDNLVPYITQTAAGIRKELSIFGNDYDTPDGTAIRDYIHVVDLAKAHVTALNRLLKMKTKKSFEVFNLGTGKGNTVLEVVNTFEKVTGIKLNYKITARRKGDIEKVWADTSLANKELSWKTEKSLADALKSAWVREKKYRGL